MIETLAPVKPAPAAGGPRPLVDLLEEIARGLEGTGLARKVLADSEKRDAITLTIHDWPAAQVAGLNAEALQELAAACRGAFQLTLQAGPFVVQIGHGPAAPAQADLDGLSKRARSVKLTMSLDKSVLLDELGLRGEHALTWLYLYPEALVKAVDRIYACGEEPGELFDVTLPAGRKTVILVREADVLLDGTWLGVAGGWLLSHWQSLLPDPDAHASKAALIQRVTGPQSPLSWLGFSYRRLTPHHLDARPSGRSGAPPATDVIGRAFRCQRLALALIYTADQTRRGDQGWACSFRSEHQAAEILLPASSQDVAGLDAEAVETLARRAVWTYGDGGQSPGSTTADFVPDRLRIFRGVVARNLLGASREESFGRLPGVAKAVDADTEGIYTSFVDGLLTRFFERVQILAGMVSSAVESLQGQTQVLVKGLADSVLASVAAAMAVFLGALFSSEAAVFQVGMTIYAVYFALIPGVVGLITVRQQFEAARQLFDRRVEDYRHHLAPETVDRIAKDGGIDSLERNFRRWFKVIAFIYGAVFIALLAAAWLVPPALLQARG